MNKKLEGMEGPPTGGKETYTEARLSLAIDRACDEIDRLRAINRELLAALTRIVTNYDTGNYADIDMPQAREAINRATSAQSGGLTK